MVLRRPLDFDISAVSLHRLPVMSDDAADIVIFPKVQEEQRWGRGAVNPHRLIIKTFRGHTGAMQVSISHSTLLPLPPVCSASPPPPLLHSPPPFFFYSLPL